MSYLIKKDIRDKFRELGYNTYVESDDGEFVQFECSEYGSHIYGEWICINLKDRAYGSEDRQGITLEEHVLLNEIFKDLGWI